MGIGRKGTSMAMPEVRDIAFYEPKVEDRTLIMANENTTRKKQFDKKSTQEYQDKANRKRFPEFYSK